MFLATLLCVTQPFSSKEKAERDLAQGLWKRENFLKIHSDSEKDYRNLFLERMNREDYAGAIAVWNDCVRMEFNCDSRWMATIVEAELDSPFP